MLRALGRRLTAAGPTLAVLLAVGALTASAATFGRLDSTSLGAGQNAGASCNTTGIALAYTNVYDAASNDYQTTAATLSGGTASLSESTGTVATDAGSQTVTLTTPVSARAVTGASLVITG